MKIIGIGCSPRKGKTTTQALEECLASVRSSVPSMKTELIELAEYRIGGCIACGKCAKEFSCSQDDDFQRLIPLLDDPDLAGMIVASPVYFGNMTSQAKAFIDRCVVFRRNGFRLRNKVGGVIAVGGVRNGGQEMTIQSIQAAMLVWDMVVVGDGQPTAHFGGTVWSGHPDGVTGDAFGLETVRNLGRRVGELASILHK